MLKIHILYKKSRQTGWQIWNLPIVSRKISHFYCIIHKSFTKHFIITRSPQLSLASSHIFSNIGPSTWVSITSYERARCGKAEIPGDSVPLCKPFLPCFMDSETKGEQNEQYSEIKTIYSLEGKISVSLCNLLPPELLPEMVWNKLWYRAPLLSEMVGICW